MDPSPANRARSFRYVLALLLLIGSCGEFHTAWFADPKDTVEVTPPDVPPPDVPPCIPLQLAGDLDLTELVAGVPFHRIIVEETGEADLWLVIAGALPKGLSLDPLTGALSGVPEESGEGSFTVRVTADDEDDVCYAHDKAVYPVTVVAQCAEDADCTALVSEGFMEGGNKALCADGGHCLLSNGCPNDPRQRVHFEIEGWDDIPMGGSEGVVTGGEVIRHARILGLKDADEVRRQVVIIFEELDAALVQLDYTLPDNWALPLQEGDTVSLRMEAGPTEGKALRIEGPGGPTHLLEGFWVPGGLPDALSLPKFESLLPLNCTSFEDEEHEDWNQVPAAATFSWDGATWTLSPGDITWTPDPTHPEAGQQAFLARLGWSMFREEITHPGLSVAPPEISALFLPADDCPGAIAKAESGQKLYAGQALAEPPAFVVSGWESFSPAPKGAVTAAFWTVDEDPFGGGFGHLEALPLTLPDPVGLGNRRLWAGAVGKYHIGLAVEDHEGRMSCITDTIRFQVFADSGIALRAELIWLPFDIPAMDGDDQLELYMRPSGSAAWENPSRVCGPTSPLPENFEGAQCAAAALSEGRPALATLKALAPSKTYGFALRAPQTNAAPMVHAPGEEQQIILRLYCDAGALEFTLPEGFSLAPGDLVEVARIAPGCVLEPLL